MVEFEPWKKRKNRAFDDPVFGFDFERIDELFDRMMRDMFAGDGGFEKRAGKPLVFGYSMRVGPDGKPQVEQFGNVKPAQGGFEMRDAMEPLVDAIKEKNSITVTAELPGVDKKDIKLGTDKGVLTVSVDAPDRQFYKEIKLDRDVITKSAKASFKNGVLEVMFERKPSAEQKPGNEIKIE